MKFIIIMVLSAITLVAVSQKLEMSKPQEDVSKVIEKAKLRTKLSRLVDSLNTAVEIGDSLNNTKLGLINDNKETRGVVKVNQAIMRQSIDLLKDKSVPDTIVIPVYVFTPEKEDAKGLPVIIKDRVPVPTSSKRTLVDKLLFRNRR